MKDLKPSKVSLCDQEDQLPDGKIRLCKENKENDGKIRLCEEEKVDPCEASAMILTGSGAPEEGSGYSVLGGIAPFAWSISAGTIEGDGRNAAVTDLSGACGMGTVSVTDACGRTLTKEVRFPDGQWVLDSSECGPCGCDIGGLNWGLNVCSIISGSSKTTWNTVTIDYRTLTGGLSCDSCAYLECVSENHPCWQGSWSFPCRCGSDGHTSVIKSIDYYSWGCP